jgi:hypothetical protein
MSGDVATFGRYGRFLQPITSRIAGSLAGLERLTFESRLRAVNHVYYGALPATTACR